MTEGPKGKVTLRMSLLWSIFLCQLVSNYITKWSGWDGSKQSMLLELLESLKTGEFKRKNVHTKQQQSESSVNWRAIELQKDTPQIEQFRTFSFFWWTSCEYAIY